MIKFSHIIVLSFLLVSLVMSSCSSDDYINSIPKESTALLSLDIPQLANSEGMLGKQNNIFKAIAVPITPVISVAIIATSFKIHAA